MKNLCAIILGRWCMVLAGWLVVSVASNPVVVRKIIRPVIDERLCNNDIHAINRNKNEECYFPSKSQRGPCDLRNLTNANEASITENDIQSVVPNGCFEMVVFISYPNSFSLQSVFHSPIFHPSGDDESPASHKSSAHSKNANPSDQKLLENVATELYDIFQRMDHDYHLRRLRFVYPSHDYESMAQLIDVLMTPRLWLTIQQESFPYSFSHQSTIFQSFLNKVSPYYSNLKEKAHSFLSIVVDKYHHDLEGYLRWLSHVHYPSYRSCIEETGVMISRHLCTNPGWAGVLGMYKYQQQYFRHAALAVYASQSNERDEVTAFEGGQGSVCRLRNRWHCAFLPSSSCLFPEIQASVHRRLSDYEQNETIKPAKQTDKSNLYSSYWANSMMKKYNFKVRRLTDEVTTKINITTGEVVNYTKNSAIPANFTECRGRDCVLQVPETHFFMTLVYNRSYAVPHDSGSVQYFTKLMGSPKTVQQRIWFHIIQHEFNDLMKVLKTQNMDVSDVWNTQPIWVPKSGSASPKSPQKSTISAEITALTDLFPGISSAENFNNFKYQLPSFNAPLKKWPGGKNKEVSYDMIELSTLDILFQSGYLLRQNYRYRAYIAHALAHFKELYFDTAEDSFAKVTDNQVAELLMATLDMPTGKSGIDSHVYYANHLSSNKKNVNKHNSEQVKSNLNKSSLKRKLSKKIDGAADPSSSGVHPSESVQTETDPMPRCIAVQIRRGDRIISAMEANKKEYSKFCQDNPEGDFGCRSVPFAFISLLNVTEVAPLLVNPDEIHHLVVSTDDEGWLLEEIELLRRTAPNWKVLFLPAPWLSHFNATDLTDSYNQKNSNMNSSSLHKKQHFKVHSHHHHNLTVTKSDAEAQFKKFGRSGLTGGIHFMSSMAMLQQCEAFVGHFDSGVAWLMYAAMCHRHANKFGICPPMFDLRKLSDFHAMYGYQY